MNKLIKTVIVISCLLITSGCVSYKYVGIHKDGTSWQIGEYMDNNDWQHSHWKCTKTGKRIMEMNKEMDEYFKTNNPKLYIK